MRLKRQLRQRSFPVLPIGDAPGTRTPNLVIKSHLLCQIELARQLGFYKRGGWVIVIPRGSRMPRNLKEITRVTNHPLHEREVAVIGSDTCNDVQPSRYDHFTNPAHLVGVVLMGLWTSDNAWPDDLVMARTDLQRRKFRQYCHCFSLA